MLQRIPNEPYVNFIELVWILVKREFFTAMEFLRFYDQEDRTWNARAIWWYAASVFVVALFLSEFAGIIQSIMFAVLVTGAAARILQVSKWN